MKDDTMEMLGHGDKPPTTAIQTNFGRQIFLEQFNHSYLIVSQWRTVHTG